MAGYWSSGSMRGRRWCCGAPRLLRWTQVASGGCDIDNSIVIFMHIDVEPSHTVGVLPAALTATSGCVPHNMALLVPNVTHGYAGELLS